MRASFAFPLVCLLLACESATEPADRVPTELDFGINRLANEAPFVLHVWSRGPALRGYFETFCGAGSASAGAATNADTLLLRIRWAQPVGCRTVALSVGYEVRVEVPWSEISHVRVIHEWSGSGRQPQTVFATNVDLVGR